MAVNRGVRTLLAMAFSAVWAVAGLAALVGCHPAAPSAVPLAPGPPRSAGAVRTADECARFRSTHVADAALVHALSWQRPLGGGPEVVVLDPLRGADTERKLTLASSATVAWRSSELAAIDRELRAAYGHQAEQLRKILAALDRRDAAAYLEAGQAMRALQTTIRDADGRLDRACGARLFPEAARLEPAKIQQVVRAQYSRFKQCYEAGLARNPVLSGRVQVRFVIDRNGNVSQAESFHGMASSDDAWAPEQRDFYRTLGLGAPAPSPNDWMPDPEVVACVVRLYSDLHFPPPEGGGKGVVTVVYPIMFSPG